MNTNAYISTSRECECLLWAAQGKAASEIAMILSISESTVRFHFKNAGTKLDTVNTTQAVALAIAHGLIPANPFDCRTSKVRGSAAVIGSVLQALLIMLLVDWLLIHARWTRDLLRMGMMLIHARNTDLACNTNLKRLIHVHHTNR